MYYVTTMNQTSNEKTCLRGIIIGMKMFSTYPSMALHKTTGCRRREVDRLVYLISLQNGGGGIVALWLVNRLWSAECGRDLTCPWIAGLDRRAVNLERRAKKVCENFSLLPPWKMKLRSELCLNPPLSATKRTKLFSVLSKGKTVLPDALLRRYIIG